MAPGLPNSQGQEVGQGLGAEGWDKGEGAKGWDGGLGEGGGARDWVRADTSFVTQTKLLIKNS